MAHNFFWKIRTQQPSWAERNFGAYWVPVQIEGIDYAGLTIFGWSILYSDHW